LYDEPSAGLDTVSSTVVENLIRDLVTHKDSQVSSYVVVTHQHSTIRRACDRLIFLHEGCVVWEGDVAEFDTTDEPIVVQFRTGSLDGPIQYK
jgi:ABC-type transporter Mla maintaining outer membrane lipid asymmetry ATPase subunit MlaF